MEECILLSHGGGGDETQALMSDVELHLQRDPLRIYRSSCEVESANYEAKACLSPLQEL